VSTLSRAILTHSTHTFLFHRLPSARSDTWEGLISATQSYMNEVFMLAAVNDVIVAVAIALLLRGERTGYQRFDQCKPYFSRWLTATYSTNLTINRIVCLF
jgi:hypothetical protein